MADRDYKSKKLIYHITSIHNLQSILTSGLQTRNQRKPMVDVANHEILNGRELHGLDKMVPFHFFADNPFDGRVQKDHPTETFVFIAVARNVAEQQGWKISAKHPLNGEFKLLDYAAGMDAIDWDLMNKREYTSPEGKSVCMAECLAPQTVPVSDFQRIYVKTPKDKETVESILRDVRVRCNVDVNEWMFAR
ncbi:DarT ssDNA thymidine ADP-ribosyltransferase family protein [Vibrio scophthalmi]|uniref:DarT ssDNA thymidine ADP-ribosyltransferase family protein n=1 Tax=Vibrio TaxID=662 RepID=UPI00021BECFA|nr:MULTISPECIES: DarT ssDNA thymidine ADP-ribosyltransferase family protein [Vibrio]EGU33108.1 hypothetical protein VIBRN418_02521 [Vibrio sp. N418]MCY9805449.1 DarT ssDNA thymidine ADP-ribosyltransferase family protein [Vibrio scophthalmi]